MCEFDAPCIFVYFGVPVEGKDSLAAVYVAAGGIRNVGEADLVDRIYDVVAGDHVDSGTGLRHWTATGGTSRLEPDNDHRSLPDVTHSTPGKTAPPATQRGA